MYAEHVLKQVMRDHLAIDIKVDLVFLQQRCSVTKSFAYDSAQRSYAPPRAPACAAVAAVSLHTETHNRLDNARETRDDGTRAARSENCPRNQRALALAGGGVNAKPSNDNQSNLLN